MKEGDSGDEKALIPSRIDNDPDVRLLAQVVAIVPQATEEAIGKLAKAGMSSSEIVRAAGFVARYRTNFPSLRRWYVKELMGLDRIEECLILRRKHADESSYVPSVVAINRILEETGFTTDSVEDVLDTFLAVFRSLRSKYPFNTLWSKLEHFFDGDILRAYHCAKERPQYFVKVLEGERDMLHIYDATGPCTVWPDDEEEGWDELLAEALRELL